MHDGFSTLQDLRAQKCGRILSIDFGTRKMGIAVSDKTRFVASPHSIIIRSSPEEDMHKILDISLEFSVNACVVGTPTTDEYSRNGQISWQNQIKSFAQNLMKSSNLPVYLQNEDYTTHEAFENMYAAGVKSKKKQMKINDKLAAANILRRTLASLN